MKRKVLLIAVALMAVAMLATPVMAGPTKGLKVDATSIFNPLALEVRSEPEGKMTEGGIFPFKGFVEVYSNNLLSIGNGPPLTVCAYQAGSGCWNTKTEVFMVHYDTVWYISTEGSPNGFSGNQELKLFGWNPTTMLWDSMTVHCVLHGFGAYAGQTLMLSYEGPISVFMYGYCLKG